MAHFANICFTHRGNPQNWIHRTVISSKTRGKTSSKKYRMGPQSIAFSCLKSGLTMFYGRYNQLVNGDYFMVYKPTNITGGPLLSELNHSKS